jgi:hypothetical protein
MITIDCPECGGRGTTVLTNRVITLEKKNKKLQEALEDIIICKGGLYTSDITIIKDIAKKVLYES